MHEYQSTVIFSELRRTFICKFDRLRLQSIMFIISGRRRKKELIITKEDFRHWARFYTTTNSEIRINCEPQYPSAVYRLTLLYFRIIQFLANALVPMKWEVYHDKSI